MFGSAHRQLRADFRLALSDEFGQGQMVATLAVILTVYRNFGVKK